MGAALGAINGYAKEQHGNWFFLAIPAVSIKGEVRPAGVKQPLEQPVGFRSNASLGRRLRNPRQDSLGHFLCHFVR